MNEKTVAVPTRDHRRFQLIDMRRWLVRRCIFLDRSAIEPQFVTWAVSHLHNQGQGEQTEEQNPVQPNGQNQMLSEMQPVGKNGSAAPIFNMHNGM
jgi:hypothetical protein